MNSDIVCDKCVYQLADGECHKLIGQRANKSKCQDICREAYPGERVTMWPISIPPVVIDFTGPFLDENEEQEGES